MLDAGIPDQNPPTKPKANTETPPGEPEPHGPRSASSGTEKLVDAGIWVFIATAMSFGTSVVYISGLSWSLFFPVQDYLLLQDYLLIAPYWIGPGLGFVLAVLLQIHALAQGSKNPKILPIACLILIAVIAILQAPTEAAVLALIVAFSLGSALWFSLELTLPRNPLHRVRRALLLRLRLREQQATLRDKEGYGSVQSALRMSGVRRINPVMAGSDLGNQFWHERARDAMLGLSRTGSFVGTP